MRRSFSLSHVVRWFTTRTPQTGEGASQSRKRTSLYPAIGLILVCALLNACSGFFGGGSSSNPTPSTLSLHKIGWCAKPLMVFHDEGAVTPTTTPTGTATATGAAGTPAAGPGTPSTISDWSVIKDHLGFTVYLPTTLPSGSCLVSAQATIHDPIFGGSFTIGYLLPDHNSLSISEAPLKSQSASFQCSATAPTARGKTGTPTATSTATLTQLCSGAKDTTNIVLSGPGSTDHLQQIFTNLQANVNWIPA